MLGTLLSSLTSLQTFLSRAFFIGAFIPTLLFAFLNGLMLYLFNWPAHRWLDQQLLNTAAAHYAILFAALFLGLWIAAFIVAALTPLWTRTLEGRNWGLFRSLGINFERRRFDALNKRINGAVAIYARIDAKKRQWRQSLQDARAAMPATPATGELSVKPAIAQLRTQQDLYALIRLEDLDGAYTKLADDIKTLGITPEVKALAEAMPLLVDYTVKRAEAEYSRLLSERNTSFGTAENIAPTEFGNVGLTAETYAMRAYKMNLPQVWGALRQATQADNKLAPALEDAKLQLDFLVASYFLFLAWSVLWAIRFALGGALLPALTFAIGGPVISWGIWYGAAVERYRVLQDLITSLLDGLRFQVLNNLHLPSPIDLEEERALWRALDLTVGSGEPGQLRYRQAAP